MKKTKQLLAASLLSSALLSMSVMSTSVLAADFDMNQTMKKMSFEFKQAAEAQSVEAMKQPVANLAELVEMANQAEHPEERTALYTEGFDKLTVVIEGVEAHLEEGELEAAQQALREVDDLRIEFHDRRNPSIWKRLFG